jgi:hypothetical protein
VPVQHGQYINILTTLYKRQKLFGLQCCVRSVANYGIRDSEKELGTFEQEMIRDLFQYTISSFFLKQPGKSGKMSWYPIRSRCTTELIYPTTDI